MNIRIAGHPIHLFTRADRQASIRTGTGPVQVRFAPQSSPIRPEDLAAILQPLFPKRQIVARELSSPLPLAEQLAAAQNPIDLVAIYDDDPSPFVADFVTYYRKQVAEHGNVPQAARVYVFPLTAADMEPRQASGTPLTYALVRYEADRFYPFAEMKAPSSPSATLTVTSTSAAAGPLDDVPIVLTNLRSTRGEQEYTAFARALSDASITALFQVQTYGNRCAAAAAPTSAPIFRTFLLNANLADPGNLLKALGLWSHFELMGTSSTPAVRRDSTLQAQILEEALGSDVNALLLHPERLAQQLAKGSRAPVRVRFSDDASTIYREAIDALKAASSAPPPRRGAHLEYARALLLQLVASHRLPRCSEPGRAMWKAEEFDPFFYLALAQSLERSEGRR